MNKKRPSFEDCIDIINSEIEKRRSKWTLSAITWMDFDDVAQIIRIHIYKKWNLYDASRPLEPWISRIIEHQIKNLRRNVYDSDSRPCLRCAASEGGDLCQIYTKQCSDCPLYAKWEQTKKYAQDVKLPVSIENHAQQVFDIPDNGIDIQSIIPRLHEKMRHILKPLEWKIYQMLFIDGLTEEQVGRQMGYTPTQKSKKIEYLTLTKIQKSIIIKVKKLLNNDELDIF